MKFFKLIIFNFFALCIIINSRHIKKTNSKLNSHSKLSENNESNKSKEDIPTFALEEYHIAIFIDEKEHGTGSFSISSITHPSVIQELGWMFKLNFEPTQEMKQLFIPNDIYYYLPYRNISHDILYVGPFKSPKRYELTITDDTGNIHYIKINFPYADADKKNFINDFECNNLKGLINELRVKIQEKLSNFKKTSSAEASNYIDIKPFLLSANKGDDELKQTVKTAELESEALALIIKDDTSTFNEIKSQYDKIEKEYIKLRNKLGYLNEKISDSKNLRVVKNKSALSFKDKKIDAIKTKLEVDSKDTENKFEIAMAKLTAELANRSTSLLEAKKVVLEKLDFGKYSKIVENVYAGN